MGSLFAFESVPVSVFHAGPQLIDGNVKAFLDLSPIVEANGCQDGADQAMKWATVIFHKVQTTPYLADVFLCQ